MFDIEYNSQSKKFLKGLDKNIVGRILNKLEQIRENPFRYLEHYEGKGYKLKIEDYRALIDIDFERKTFLLGLSAKEGESTRDNFIKFLSFGFE
ncbi:MAG TPA: hypothetical protein VJ208_00475 [Candidatus Nanoarchaeia archaeon]|nr:hypothetical protein [Candidatus Nanoarchaeia archaeon]